MRLTLLRSSVALAIAVLAAGCLPAPGEDDTGTGGSTGTAGTTGTGGSTDTGGTTGTGGTTSTGGTTGTGGGIAGNTGSGGSTGGATGGGGATGAAGATGGGGAGATGGGGSTGAAGAPGGRGGSQAGSGGSQAGSGGSTGRGGSGGGNAGRGGGGGGSTGTGGGGSTGTGGGTGGGGAYNPCPTNGDPCRILPVGDSITFGIQQEGAWRIQLFRRTIMAMQKITYTGTLQNGPTMVDGVAFPRRYEATSGITIDGISNQITSKNTLNMPCDIIMVHIGTNDMYMNPSGAPTRLGNLIDKLVTGMPNALIVIAKIVPFPGGASAVTTYNNALPAIIKTRADAGKHVILIDLNTGFPANGLSSDNVHPNATGYAWMGDRFYESVSTLLPR